MRYAKRIEGIKASAIREAGKKIAARPECISFAQGLPDPALFPSEEIREITNRILRDKPEIALQYGPTKGYEPLLKKIVEDMKKRGMECNQSNIQITTGSQQGISFLSMAFLDPGDVVLTEEPTYLGALAAFRPFECEFKGVATDRDGMNMGALEETLKETPRAKLIYIVPNFSNPSGSTMSEKKRKQLITLAKEYDVMIIEDNPYGDIRFEGESLMPIKSYDKDERVAYLGSYSKVLCSGLRVGWICGEKGLIEKIEILKQGVDLQTNQLAQMQIDEYLEVYDIEEQIQKVAGVYHEKRDAMIEGLKKSFPSTVEYIVPEGGMFLWVILPATIDAEALLDKALESNVGYVPGGPFFPEGGGTNTIRLNFSMVSIEEIQEGMERLGRVIKACE